MSAPRIETLTVGAFESNCHILRREASDLALVIDPGGDADAIIDFLRAARLQVAAYLVTHGHMDHVHALADVSAVFPAPCGMAAGERGWAFSPENAWPPWYDEPRPPADFARDWREGQTWTDAGFDYAILETPGHSPGHVAFYFPADRLLFSGDVLFNGGIGRTDLRGGHAPTLLKSLRRLMELPDDVRVFPGHGPETTIGHERRSNPFLLDTSWAG